MAHTEIDPITARRLSLDAAVDLRTLTKALRGEPIRGLAGHRARAALRNAGFEVPEPPPRGAVLVADDAVHRVGPDGELEPALPGGHPRPGASHATARRRA